MQKLQTLLNIFACALCLCPVVSVAQGGGGSVTVSGVVTSAEEKEPLIGVNVISGATTGVSTLVDGSYTIEVEPGTKLIYQYIGYQAAEFVVPAGSAAVRHDVALQSDAQQLEDVVVIAYGVRKKGTVTGSVSTVKAEKIEDTPTASFDQALQGQVAGLTVLAESGEPSKAATMYIRGTNSINSGKSPLFILDGVAIESTDFNSISPSDIESISVLKDASSTSIYGARAANGVVVISTKRGRMADRPKIDYRMQLGFSQLAHGNWELMNTSERIRYEQEIGLSDGKDYNLLGRTDVNWLDEVFKDNAMLQNYELSVSGASDKTSYFVSGGFYNQEGITLGSSFERYSIRANIEQRAARWLKVGTNTMLNYQNVEQADDGEYYVMTPISAAHFMLPYWNPYNPDGSIAKTGETWTGDGTNPIEWSYANPLKRKRYKVLSTIFAEAEPLEGFILRSQFSVDYTHQTAFMKSAPSYAPNLGRGTAGRNSSDGMTLSVTNTINYRFRPDDKHAFNFLVGQEGIDARFEGFSVTSNDQNNDKLTNLSTGTRVSSWSDTPSNDFAFLSFFGRVEYNYTDRYYAEVSARADGSSRFGRDGRWAGFWSAGFMWNLRNERFMESARRWLTVAQISLSSGTSGNSSIPNYEHLALVGGGFDYYGDAGIGLTQQGNETLSWEKLWTTNLGLHLGFWNRLTLDLELYNKKTTDMLMEVPQLYSDKGFGFKWENVGAMINRGVELNLAATLVASKGFQWDVNANVSYNKNKLTELYNGVQEYERSTTATKLVVGHSVGEFFLNRFAGVNPANGDALWYDKDGNLTTEFKDSDKVMTGKSFYAPWQGGFGTTLSWKGIALSAQFGWVADRYMINNDRFFDESNGRFTAYNQSRRLLDRWKKPGDVTDIPRHGVYTEFDSRLLEDASFLRLKNLMLSYTFPREWIRRSGFLSGARIYAQAQNLLTFTSFTGLDPENVANVYKAKYPMSRQFTFGLDLTF